MLHVNNREGYTVAVSENEHIARIARRTVLSDSAFSIVLPLLEDMLGWKPARIRALFAQHGLALQEWERSHTDRVTLRDDATPLPEVVA